MRVTIASISSSLEFNYGNLAYLYQTQFEHFRISSASDDNGTKYLTRFELDSHATIP